MKGTRFVTRLAVVVLGLSLAAPAHAISRYASTSMSCGSVKATVRSEGAVILRWTSSQGNSRYKRVVASNRYCDPGEVAVVTYVPSSNTGSCAVRECVHRTLFDDDDGLWFLFGRRH